ncbi:MAG: family 43 glycosylhydrolase [Asticcacaulis sp.]
MPSRRQLLTGIAAASLSPVLVVEHAQAQETYPFPEQPPEGQRVKTGDPMPAPARGFYPYSGISGPGLPAGEYSRRGGWVTGSKGVRYAGPNPHPYKTLPYDGPKGTAVTDGLIPQIQPLLELHIRDTVICLGGDGHYYMTGSTGDNIWAFNDGVELWRSADLKHWDYMGLVWSLERDGGWEKQWVSLHGLPSRAIWAPEIHYAGGTFFIVLSMAPSGCSILKSTTGKAEGPYVHAFSPDKPVVMQIDPTLFEDDDGSVYFTAGSAKRIVKLKADFSGFDGDWRDIDIEPVHDKDQHAPKCVPRGMNDLGHEGAVLFKAHGKYYLGAADNPYNRYSTMLAVSDTIWGPYRMRHESVPCGGGTNFFRDKDGHWWCSYFGNDDQSPFREKPAIVRAAFDKDGRVGVDRAFYGLKQ